MWGCIRGPPFLEPPTCSKSQMSMRRSSGLDDPQRAYGAYAELGFE